LNAEEDAATENLLLSAIERRVAERNKINHARMELGNAVPPSEVHDRAATVSLLLPREIRNSWETRRIMARVVQHAPGGYQLVTQFGLIKGRFQHQDLNGSALELPEIPVLTVKEADKEPKIELTKIVQLMNNRGPISGEQRAGRKRKQAQRERDDEEEEQDRPGEGSPSRAPPRLSRRRGAAPPPRTTRSTRSITGSVIEVQLQPGSSPSAGAANRGVARETARGGRRGWNSGRAPKRTRR
jgi:hypothetical protein